MTKRWSSTVRDLTKTKRQVSKEDRAAARAALARMDARKDENVDEWAEKLAGDLSEFDD